MRAGLCTVSAPLAACSPAAALPPSARFLALHLLHQQTLYFIVQAKSRVKELYHQTCRHFAQQGMLDTDLFGLALICGKHSCWTTKNEILLPEILDDNNIPFVLIVKYE